MGLGGCDKCIKYLLFGFNLIFWVLGCAILGLGLFIRFSPDSQKIFEGGEFEMLNSIQFIGAYILIGVGAVMMVVGFLGCCGAIRENPCLLGSFFACLFLLFCIMLGCGVWAFISLHLREAETRQELTNDILERVRSYKQNPKFMDTLQSALVCCGAHNSTDYAHAGIVPVPTSCGDAIIDTYQYDTGCSKAIMDTFRESVILIAAAGIVVAVCLVFGMIFSMCLLCAIRQGNYVA